VIENKTAERLSRARTARFFRFRHRPVANGADRFPENCRAHAVPPFSADRKAHHIARRQRVHYGSVRACGAILPRYLPSNPAQVRVNALIFLRVLHESPIRSASATTSPATKGIRRAPWRSRPRFRRLRGESRERSG